MKFNLIALKLRVFVHKATKSLNTHSNQFVDLRSQVKAIQWTLCHVMWLIIVIITPIVNLMSLLNVINAFVRQVKIYEINLLKI